MSHKIPTTLIPSESSANFLIHTDSGSISVSGIFSLLGNDLVSTVGTGVSFIYVIGTAASSDSLIIQADTGTASPSSGILNFMVPPNSVNYITITGTGNTLTLLSNVVPPSLGGTGNSFLPPNSLLYGQGTSPTGFISAGLDGQLLLGSTNQAPAFQRITSTGNTLTFSFGANSLNIEVDLSVTVSNFLSINNGGTGRSFLTVHGVLIGDGSQSINVTDPGTNGQVLIAATGADPAFSTITSTGGTLQFTSGPNSLNIDVNLSGSLFSPIFPISGGTGRTIFTTYGVLVGAGSLAIHATDPGTNGQVLIAASGANPKFSTLTSSGGTLTFIAGPHSLAIEVNAANLTFGLNTLTVNIGGTGQTVLTVSGVLIGAGTLPVRSISSGTDGQALIASSTGDPAFATISSTGNTLIFTLGNNSLNIDINTNLTLFNLFTVSEGGTGQTVLTAYGVLIGAGTLPVRATAFGTDGQALIASSTGDPAFATISSTGNSLLFTSGKNSLNMEINFANTFFRPLSPPHGGTGRTLLSAYGVLIGEGSLNVNVTAAGTNGQLLLASSTGDPRFATITSTGGTLSFSKGHNGLNIDVNIGSISFFDILEVGYGGTSQTLLTIYGVLIGEGSVAINVTASGTDGQTLIAATGKNPKFSTLTSSGGTLSFTFGPNSINMDVALTGDLVILADTGTAAPAGLFLNLLGTGLISTSGTGSTVAVLMDTTASFFNPLQVPNGGTGQTALTAYGVLIGRGTNPVHVTAAGTDGQLLLAATSQDPQFATVISPNSTLSFIPGPNSLNIDIVFSQITFPNPMPVRYGGTGRTVLTAFGVLLGEGSLRFNVTDPGINGQVLIASTTGDPKFANITSSGGTLTFFFGSNMLDIEVNLSGASFALPFPVAQGGTGNTIFTTFGVLIGEGSLSIRATDAGTNGQVLIAATGLDPKFSRITSTGGTLTFSFGPNSLNIDLNLKGSSFFNPFPPARGGTGRTMFTTFGVLIGNGTGPVNVTAPGTDGQALIGATGADPRFMTITSTGGTLTFSLGPNSLNIEVNLSTTLFSPIPVARGGTGRTLLTAFGVLVGRGSLPVHVTSAGTNGQMLIAANGANPAFATITSTGGTVAFNSSPNGLSIDLNFSGAGFPPLEVNQGGTGQTLLTMFGVLIGKGSLDVQVTAAGTDGQILLSATGADPAFATITSTGGTVTFTPGPNALGVDINLSGYFNPLPVARGGTSVTSFTPYAVICGGVNPTASWQNVASPGTAGQVLTSNGPGLLPTFQNPAVFPSLTQTNVLTFAVVGSSVYNPSIGVQYCMIQCIGGGGGGGGATGSASAYGVGGGGGGGGYAQATFPVSYLLGPQTVIVGVGGTGGSSAGLPGGNGGNTSVGNLLIAYGGSGGNSGRRSPTSGGDHGAIALGGFGGTASALPSGYINIQGVGQPGSPGFALHDGGKEEFAISGEGGSSYFQVGTPPVVAIDVTPGTTSSRGLNGAASLGAGGSGAATIFGTSSPVGKNGGNGSSGVVIITEYF